MHVVAMDEIDYWAAHPDPSEAQLAELADAWVRYESVERSDVDDEDPDRWACDAVLDLDGTRPDLEWRVIRCLCAAADPSSWPTVSSIGAGPLEDFLRRQGASALDLVEPSADADPVLLDALECVWGWDEPFRPRLESYLAARGRTTR
jgi:Family of unknown function (DUF6869)